MVIKIGDESYDTQRCFEYENGFYLSSDVGRIGKLLAHYELYKMIKEIPGAIVECGVFKGASLIRLATFRELFESPLSRKVIGFDIFDRFPDAAYHQDIMPRRRFTEVAGDESISVKDLEEILGAKGIRNFQLIKGDIVKTVPEYLAANPHLKIALLHIDTDIYEPAVAALEHLFGRVSRGGIIAFDDYGTFPGETKAVDEFFAVMDVTIRKFPFSHIPSYVVKP